MGSKHISIHTSIPMSKDEASAPVPRDVRLVALILASMGIEDAEPAVLIQLLEFANRALRC